MSDTQNMEQAQEVQHSPKFEDIKGYHDSGFWNAAMVKMLSRKRESQQKNIRRLPERNTSKRREKAGALQKSTWHNAL